MLYLYNSMISQIYPSTHETRLLGVKVKG